MNPFSFLNKREDVLAIDIGTGAVKMVELIGSSAQPSLLSFAIQPLETEIFANNSISKPEILADVISKLCQGNQIEGKRVAVSLPAPAVFTKRIKMQKQGIDELRDSVQFEAANFIPHKIDAVKLDFAIVGETGKNQLDILVVAVKKELLESIEDCLGLAGLECAIADVDFFALHNVFQANYSGTLESDSPLSQETCAILSVGHRYTSLVISRAGLPLFVGDVSIGLKQLEEELVLKLSLTPPQSYTVVQTFNFSPETEATVSSFVDQITQELSRQLSFFWNTCGVEGSISRVFVAGGGALLPGFVDSLGRKTGFNCSVLDPFLKVSVGNQVDKKYLEKVAPLLAVAVGLGLRTPGDGVAG